MIIPPNDNSIYDLERRFIAEDDPQERAKIGDRLRELYKRNAELDRIKDEQRKSEREYRRWIDERRYGPMQGAP